MLPEMSRRLSAKPRIAIVGAGNLASALAGALHRAGYVVAQIVSSGSAASVHRARRLAREVGTTSAAISTAEIRADVIWFCVPDSAIAEAAKSLATASGWRNKVALHSSGALTSDELAVLRKRGASVASVHPLMTFVPGSRPALAGVSFAIEGDRKARQVARSIVLDLSGRPVAIGKAEKEIYHAWGMFASPLLTALLAAGERVAAAAGVSRKSARARALPILRQTLMNYEALGAAGSFSGPIVRGDTETVKKHLKVLRKVPGASEVYVALAEAALRDLPAKNRATLRKLFKP
jgi:predicted short-subunit dehydrogenase-like oxidoreductase (DUF2520 family)